MRTIIKNNIDYPSTTIVTQNIYNTINSPIVIEGAIAGINDTHTLYYQKFNPIISITSSTELVQMIGQNIFQAPLPGSYPIWVTQEYTPLNLNCELLFNVYLFKNLFINNQEHLLKIISQELPFIYKSTNALNLADNSASAAIFALLYKYIYTSYYNVVSSIGINTGYNPQWELVYCEANNFLQNAVYPAQVLNTLMQISVTTGVTIRDLSIILSRLRYQFTGNQTAIEIFYDDTDLLWQVNIYPTGQVATWELGVSGNSNLGISTLLGDRSSGDSFLWFLYVICKRLFPVFVKFRLTYLTYTDFIETFYTNFDYSNNFMVIHTTDIKGNIINYFYDAYMVTNNNKEFNTTGFKKR